MPREVEIPDARKREHMQAWFAMGDTPEGLIEACDYLYRTAPSRLSPSGLMCVLSAAMDAMRDKDTVIADLRTQLAEAQQGQLFATKGGK
jgi:hypothetical protein